MTQLNPIQFKILNSLLFAESFDTLVEECGEKEGVLADELKSLIDGQCVQVMEYDEAKGDYRLSIYYDSDNMRAFYYRVTSRGLKLQEQF